MKNNYQIDPVHSSALFSVRHMMMANVRGGFSGVTGTVVYDPENPAATTVHAEIDATTLNTLDEKRDGHVKSAEFLDTGQFPKIVFTSKRVEQSADGELRVIGDLTLHGVTKQVELDVEGPAPEAKDPWGNTRTGASARTKVKRSDFGLSWNATLETGGLLISDDLKIELEVELVKAQGTAA